MVSNVVTETRNHSILDIMKDGVLSVRQDEPVFKAISTMMSRHVSSLPVVDSEGRLAGMISEKDVLKLLYDIGFDGGLVEDYMTRDVVAFDINDSVDDVLDCFKKRPFRKVAILQDGKLISAVDRRDIMQAYKEMFMASGSGENNNSGEFTAKDVMTHGLFTVKVDTPVCDAIDLMLKRNVTGLPVVDDGMYLKGIISEKDIIDMIGDEQKCKGVVGDFMTEKVVSFSADVSLYDICDCLINNNFRRVTILDNGKLVGIISRANIISFILQYSTTVRKQKIMHDERLS